MIRLRSLRGRLLTAFVLVAVPPLLVLAVAVSTLLSRSFETSTRERLASALRSALAEVDRTRSEAREKVQRIVEQDLPALASTPEGSDSGIGKGLAERRELPALELVDAGGRVISSRHWAAGFGLPDRDQTFPGDPELRIEKVDQDYGLSTRLAVMASREASWRGRPVMVRGGSFLDAAFLTRLGDLAGVEVALRDELQRQWIAPDRSPLALWADPALAGYSRAAGYRSPAVSLGGAAYRWASVPVNPSLLLVVAMPAGRLEILASQVRRLGFAIAGAALLLALATAFFLAGRLARPVHELAQAASRVAAGDLSGEVRTATADEIGDLARTFNGMTAELRTSRERLLQAERVAAWREMARRLAHELKNPIFPIQLSIETLRRVSDQEEGGASGKDGRFRSLFRESSETILAELRSLRQIIDEFSQFARMPRPRLTPTDINAVATRALDLYRPGAGPVGIETMLAPGLPPIPADPDLLGRALGNLLANAMEAMPDGGTLRLRSLAGPDAVLIEVEDTGPGLDQEQKTRLFTPYFTTKRGGTGLGLAIVQGVVSDHGGRVEVRSEPGVGTVFTLVFPI
ncbi:MAG TPA: ATP-binding protein [Vicinamibacteria bacterium]|nr:ATP-binding protein [Vicinamibacteria bacterium]